MDFEVSKAYARPSISRFASRSGWLPQLLLQLHVCLHATMTIMDWLISEAVSKPQWNSFFYMSSLGHGVSLSVSAATVAACLCRQSSYIIVVGIPYSRFLPFHNKQMGGMFVSASAPKVVTSPPIARCCFTFSYATCDDLTTLFKTNIPYIYICICIRL